jgi:FkbM family methyltransferase
VNRSVRLTSRRVRQTFRFANAPRVLADLAFSGTPWRHDELTFRTRDGITIACPNQAGARVPVYEVLVEDCYRIDELRRWLPSAPVVLDIGAQVGCFTIALASRIPTASVHAYEASPTTARWLERNVRQNGLDGRIVTHATAVSDRAGSMDIYDNAGGSALNGVTAVGGTLVAVPCVSFRDAVTAAGGQVDLVKLDTEGAEYAIVLATSPTDWAGVHAVVLEYHDVPGHSWSELERHFEAAGFSAVRHQPAGPRQGTVWLRRVG